MQRLSLKVIRPTLACALLDQSRHLWICPCNLLHGCDAAVATTDEPAAATGAQEEDNFVPVCKPEDLPKGMFWSP